MTPGSPGTFTAPGEAYVTGDALTYAVGDGGQAIGGLVDGKTYYVLTTPTAGVFELTTAPALMLDPTTTAANSMQTFTPVTPVVFEVNAIDTTQNSIFLPNNGFAAGDTITYTAPSGGTAISGLASGGTYGVNPLDGSNFQLLDTSGNVIAIAQGAANGVQRFTDTHKLSPASTTISKTVTLDLGAVAADGLTMTLANNGFTNGQTLSFSPDATTSALGTLTNAGTYTVATGTLNASGVFTATNGPANSFELLDSSGAAASVAPASGVGRGAFYVTGTALQFAPTTAVDPATGEITLPNSGLTNGQAVVYGVDYALGSTSTATPEYDASGQAVMQTVVTNDPAIAGLTDGQTYYVVVVDKNHIRLVSDPSLVQAAQPIVFTKAGLGLEQTLSPQDAPVTGIAVGASLTDTLATAADGQTAAKEEPAPAESATPWYSPSALLAKVFGSATPASEDTAPAAQDNTGSGSEATPPSSNTLAKSGAVAFSYIGHTVTAATGVGAQTTLTSDGDLAVTSTISETTTVTANSALSKPDGDSGTAVALAVAINLFNNTATATIGADTVAFVTGTVTVTGSIDYPALWADDYTTLTGDFTTLLGDFKAKDTSAGIPDLKTGLMDASSAKQDLSSFYANETVGASADAAAEKATGGSALSGAVGLTLYTNDAEAVIAGGAQIGGPAGGTDAATGATSSTGATEIDVAAATTMSIIDIAGNPSDVNRNLEFSNKSNGSASGGDLLLTDVSNTTLATIGAGAVISTDALSVTAADAMTRVEVALAAAQAGAANTRSVVGSGLGYRQRSTTIAAISAGATIDDTGTLEIAAASGALSPGEDVLSPNTIGLQLSIAGAMDQNAGGGAGIGASFVVNDIQRLTAATIGSNATGTWTATPAASSSITAGDTSITATTNGIVVIVAVAGTSAKADSKTDQATAPDGATATEQSPLTALSGASDNVTGDSGNTVTDKTVQDASNSGNTVTTTDNATKQASKESAKVSASTGLGIAGSGLVNNINDTTLAYINTTGTIATGALAVTADNNQVIVAVSGAVAVQSKTSSTTKSTTIGGAIGINLITADTEAFLQGVTATVDGALGVTARHEGFVNADAAAMSANAAANGNGNGYAGSLSFNELTDTEKASLIGVTLNVPDAGVANTSTTDITLVAEDAVRLIAVGGGIAYAGGATGIGAAIGFNQIGSTIFAGVQGGTLDAHSLSITADNATNLMAIGVSAAVSDSKTPGTAAAFTVGVNILANSATSFSPATHADTIEAAIQNATVNTTGDVSLVANDAATIMSLAGAIGAFASAGTSNSGGGFGIGISWNEIVQKETADITASFVTAANVGVVATLGGTIDTAALGGAYGHNAGAGSISINAVLDSATAEIIGAGRVAASAALTVSATDKTQINNLDGSIAVSVGGSGGVAGGGALGGSYIHDSVLATIATASVSAGAGGVSVTAAETAGIRSIAVAGAGGTGYAIAGAATVSVIATSTSATIGNATTVTATSGGGVTVRANDTLRPQSLAGAAALSTAGAIGLGVDLTSLSATVTASIGAAATVDASGDIEVLASASESVQSYSAAGSVSTGSAAFAGTGDGVYVSLSTQAFIGANAKVTSEQASVEVSALDQTTIQALAGNIVAASGLSIGVVAVAEVVTKDTEAWIADSAIVTAHPQNGGTLANVLTGQLAATLPTASRSGVAVVAVSTDDGTLDAIGASLSLSGANANIALALAIDSITTKAHIDNHATVTSDGSVYVDAGRSYNRLLGAQSVASSLAGISVVPAASTVLLSGATQATVTGATITGSRSGGGSGTGDVEVMAQAAETIAATAAGIAAGAGGGVAGSVAVISFGKAGGVVSTLAEIAGSSVRAAGNVAVLARDVTTAAASTGAYGEGENGAGGSAATTLIYKKVSALIDSSTVSASGTLANDSIGDVLSGAPLASAGTPSTVSGVTGVVVQADASETVTDLAGAVAAGAFVGGAGAVGTELLSTDVTAAVQTSSTIQTSGHTLAVGALDQLS